MAAAGAPRPVPRTIHEAKRRRRNEIAALDDGTEVFRAVGKMFLLSDKPGVDALLGGQLDKGETRASQLTARAQFLDRRIKEQTSEFQQLVQTAQAQAVAA